MKEMCQAVSQRHEIYELKASPRIPLQLTKSSCWNVFNLNKSFPIVLGYFVS